MAKKGRSSGGGGSSNRTINYQFQADVTQALSNITELLKGFQQLQHVSQSYSKSSRDESKQTKETSKTHNTASKSVKSHSSSLKSMDKTVKVLKRSLESALAPVTKLKDAFAATTKSSGIFGEALKNISGAAVGAALAESAASAINMTEAINLFTVAMKDSIATGREFVYTTSEMLGLDPTNLMQMTGLFYEMGYAADIPTEAASELSIGLSKLAINVSSLFNMPIEKVADNLTSGIRGMSRAVVKYGMDIRATTVEAYAQTLGIQEQYETMNEASRILLRYLVMVRQASDANSDFTETIETPANQLRIMKEQVIQLGRTIGRYLVQAFKDVLPVINGVIMAIRLVLEAIADFFGIFSGDSARDVSSTTDEVSSGVSDIGSSAEDTTKKLEDMLAPFDELNIISKDISSSSSGGTGGTGLESELVDPRILAELDKVESKLGEVRMKALDVRDAILEFLGLRYNMVLNLETGEVEQKLEVIPGQFADQLIKAFQREDYSAVGTIIAEKLNTVIQGLPSQLSWDTLGPGIQNSLGAFITALNSFIGTLDWFSVGATFGSALTTAVNTISFVAESFSWTNFGNAIANSLNGFMSTFKLSSATIALANILNGMLDSAIAFASTFDWSEFGKNIIDGINNFFYTLDAKKLGKAAQSLVEGLSDAVIDALNNLDLNAVVDFIIEFFLNVDWFKLWADVSEAMLTGLKKGMETKFYILYNAAKLVTDAILAFVKAFLGIHSPSTEFAEIGENCILGIPEGMQAAISGVLTWIGDNIVTPITNKFSDLATNISGAADTAVTGFKTAFEGIQNWFSTNIGDPLAETVTSMLNGVITGFESFLNFLISGLNWLVNQMNKISFTAPDWVPVIGGMSWGFNLPNLDSISLGRVKLANGGVITRPTEALIGEGSYDEAVIPLGNSPQMESMLNRFADIVAGQQGGGETVVKVYIGDKEWDAFTYESAQRGQRIVGRKPVREGT